MHRSRRSTRRSTRRHCASRHALPEADDRRHPPDDAAAPGRRVLRAADRVRQRRESHARAGRRPASGRSGCAWRSAPDSGGSCASCSPRACCWRPPAATLAWSCSRTGATGSGSGVASRTSCRCGSTSRIDRTRAGGFTVGRDSILDRTPLLASRRPPAPVTAGFRGGTAGRQRSRAGSSRGRNRAALVAGRRRGRRSRSCCSWAPGSWCGACMKRYDLAERHPDRRGAHGPGAAADLPRIPRDPQKIEFFHAVLPQLRGDARGVEKVSEHPDPSARVAATGGSAW